jgi:hypothetical protein
MNNTVIRDLLANKRLWIGPDYSGGMILADSTYQGTATDVLNLEYYFRTANDKTFNWICHSTGNPGETEADRRRAYAPHIFYNYVADSLGEFCRAADDEELSRPENEPRLIEVLQSQSVQAVWILGIKQAGYSKPIVDRVIGKNRCVVSRHPSHYMQKGLSVNGTDYRTDYLDFCKLVGFSASCRWEESVNGIDIYRIEKRGIVSYRIDQMRYKFTHWLELEQCRAYAKQLAPQKRRQL